MKILALQDYLRVGGTERQFLDLTRRWASAGHEVERVVFRRGGPLLPQLPAGERERIHFLQPFTSPWNWWAPGLLKCIERLNPDLIFCMGRNAHCAVSRKILRKWGAKIVATHRTGRNLPRSYVKVLQSVPLVVANSHYAKERSLQAGASPKSVHVVPNGCLLPPVDDRTQSEESNFRSRIGASGDDIVFLCVGSFVPGKNQKTLLQIWEDLPQEVRQKSHLCFAGEGVRLGDCQRQARRIPHNERIHFLGNVADTLPLYRAADIAVSVSQEESFPNFVVEAHWMGLPVVALECAGLAEYIEQGENGYLYPYTPEGLDRFAEALQRLSASAEQRKEMGRKARERARTVFAPEASAQKYLDLFFSFVKKP